MYCSVFLFYFNYRMIFGKIPMTNIRKSVQSKFVVILFRSLTDASTGNDLQIIFDEFWKYEILNVNIIQINDNGASNTLNFTTYTYFPYALHNCSKANVRIIATNLTKFNQQTIAFFPKKLSNFYHCPLKLITFDTPSGIEVILTRNRRGEIIDFNGLEGMLLKTLSQSLGFRTKIFIPEKLWGNIYENGTADGAMKLMMDRMVNLSIGLFHQTYQYNALFDLSSSYYSTYFCFVVPPGRPYTSIEKLLQPFSNDIWYILLTVILIVIALKMLSIRSPANGIMKSVKMQDFIRIGMGIDLLRFPKSMCAKIFLMILIFGSLILRTIYQSSLINFLVTTRNFSAAQSIEDMVNQGFAIYFLQPMLFLVDFIPNIRPM